MTLENFQRIFCLKKMMQTDTNNKVCIYHRSWQALTITSLKTACTSNDLTYHPSASAYAWHSRKGASYKTGAKVKLTDKTL